LCFPLLVYIVVNVFGASGGVFMCFWWFGVSLLWFFPLQLGRAIVMSPFNNASLMCVACLGVSVLAKAYDLMKFQSWGDWGSGFKEVYIV